MLTSEHETVASAAQDERLVHAAVRAFFNVAEAWQLEEADQRRLLDDLGRTTLYAWRRNPPRHVSQDVMRRLSYVLGIHALLRQLFPDALLPQMAARVRRANPVWFTGGRSLLKFMVDGGPVAMHQVRSYLVSEAGADVGALPSDASAEPGAIPQLV